MIVNQKTLSALASIKDVIKQLRAAQALLIWMRKKGKN